MRSDPRLIWGVLGGMGPLSSAEFLRTIYLSCTAKRDQDFPIVFVLSDPTFPDRTEVLRSGNDNLLLEHLTSNLETLVAAGCERIVICCMTIHALLPKLRPELRSAIVSLATLLLKETSERRGRYLLLCSGGTRQAGVLESNPLWNCASEKIVLPRDSDQRRIHREIYEIKTKGCHESTLNLIWEMMAKYGADSFIVGCSEVHMIARYLEQRNALPKAACIDPFLLLAREIAGSARNTSLVVANGC